MLTHQEVQMASCTVCRKVKEPRAKEVSMASATKLWKVRSFGQVLLRKGWTSKGKGQGKKGDSKGWNESKGWIVGKGWSDSKSWNSSRKGWEQQKPEPGT